jgi:hypothetical protein
MGSVSVYLCMYIVWPLKSFPNIAIIFWLLPPQILTNGGFCLANLLSCLDPTPLTLTTPAELRPYGWTTTDLWSAPLVTGIYALFTHAQPFWGNLHAGIMTFLGIRTDPCFSWNTGTVCTGIPKAMDEDSARAVCTVILCGLFMSRTIKNFRGDILRGWKGVKGIYLVRGLADSVCSPFLREDTIDGYLYSLDGKECSVDFGHNWIEVQVPVIIRC